MGRGGLALDGERAWAAANYAAWRAGSGSSAPTFHGNSYSMRLIRCSATRSRTCRQYRYGYISLSSAVPTKLWMLVARSRPASDPANRRVAGSSVTWDMAV